MSTTLWQFQLDDHRGIVHLSSTGETDKGADYDLHEVIGRRGNFCGVKYATMKDARRGVLNISWLRYAKWRETFR